jgi:DNA-damage-inducible protein J
MITSKVGFYAVVARCWGWSLGIWFISFSQAAGNQPSAPQISNVPSDQCELQCHSKYGANMAANQLVQTRIDGTIKDEAAAVLAAMGLTVSDAVRLMLTKVAKEHALPFDPVTAPNATTIAAIKQARAGKLPRAKSIADLKKALSARD